MLPVTSRSVWCWGRAVESSLSSSLGCRVLFSGGKHRERVRIGERTKPFQHCGLYGVARRSLRTVAEIQSPGPRSPLDEGVRPSSPALEDRLSLVVNAQNMCLSALLLVRIGDAGDTISKLCQYQTSGTPVWEEVWGVTAKALCLACLMFF